MHPPLHTKTTYNTNARHTAGRFAFCYCPKEIRLELTKVNNLAIAISMRQLKYHYERIKPLLTNSEPISCKGMILLSIKPCIRSVNKINRVFSCPGPAPHLPEPEQIIQHQHTQPGGKQHHGVWPPILLVKFANHPYTVGHYPQHYGYIMKELRFAASRVPQQVYGYSPSVGVVTVPIRHFPPWNPPEWDSPALRLKVNFQSC